MSSFKIKKFTPFEPEPPTPAAPSPFKVKRFVPFGAELEVPPLPQPPERRTLGGLLPEDLFMPAHRRATDPPEPLDPASLAALESTRAHTAAQRPQDLMAGVRAPVAAHEQAPLPDPYDWRPDWAKNLATSFMKGTVEGVPSALIGLGDLAVSALTLGQVEGGAVGRAAESVGFKPGDYGKLLDSYYTKKFQEDKKSVREADGLLETAWTALQRPEVVFNAVVESLPVMFSGGAIGRGLSGIKGLSAASRAGVGEGIMAGGSAHESIRQESGGKTTLAQQVAAAGSGALTTIFGRLGNKLAEKLKIADIDTMIAGAATDPVARRNFATAVAAGFIQEGLFEELPQSVQEAVLQNIALEKPWHEGLDEASVMAMFSGGLMGAGAQTLDQGPRALAGATARAGRSLRDLIDPTETGVPVSQRTLDAVRKIEQHVRDVVSGSTPEGGAPTAPTAPTGPPDLPPPVLGPEFLPVDTPAAPPPTLPGPPSTDAVIDRITGKLATGETMGTPESRAAFAERQRVEAERAAAEAARGGAPVGAVGAVGAVEAPPVAETPAELPEPAPEPPQPPPVPVFNEQDQNKYKRHPLPGLEMGRSITHKATGHQGVILDVYQNADATRTAYKVRWSNGETTIINPGGWDVEIGPEISVEEREARLAAAGVEPMAPPPTPEPPPEAPPVNPPPVTPRAKPWADMTPEEKAAAVKARMEAKRGGEPAAAPAATTPSPDELKARYRALNERRAALSERYGDLTKEERVELNTIVAEMRDVTRLAAGKPVLAERNEEQTVDDNIESWARGNVWRGEFEKAVKRGVTDAELDAVIKKALTSYSGAHGDDVNYSSRPSQGVTISPQPGLGKDVTVKGKALRDAVRRLLNIPKPTEGKDAAEKGKQSKDRKPQREKADGGGTAAETGRGDRAAEGGQEQAPLAPGALVIYDEDAYVVDSQEPDGTYTIRAEATGRRRTGIRREQLEPDPLTPEQHARLAELLAREDDREDLTEAEQEEIAELQSTLRNAMDTLRLRTASPIAANEDRPKVRDYELGEDRLAQEDIFPPPAHQKVLPNLDHKAEWEKRRDEGLFISQAEAEQRLEAWKAAAKAEGETGANANKVIYSLFDRTGAWSQPWRDAGYVVRTYDITTGDDLVRMFPTADIVADKEAGLEVVGVLAAPPCTSFAVSGARWWESQHDKANQKLVEEKYGYAASEHFDTPLDYAVTLVNAARAFVELAAPSRFHVLENPVGRIQAKTGLPKPVLTWHPAHFGDPFTKKTQLWGSFNPDLPMAPVYPTEGSFIATLRGDDPAQKLERSITPEGFAYAFFMANRADREAPAAEAQAGQPSTLSFRSGNQRAPADLEGFIANGSPIGITPDAAKSVWTRAIDYARSGGQVFIDSGAFQELTSGTAPNFTAVLDRYDAFAKAIGPEHAGNLYVVAPDKVGDATVTRQRQEQFKERIDSLLERGVNVVLPVQVSDLLAAHTADAVRTFPKALIGLPGNKAAISTEQLRTVLGQLQRSRLTPRGFHFLGIGATNPRFGTLVADVRAAFPNATITSDSNRTRAFFRPGSKATAAVKDRTATAADNAIDTEPAIDTTELTGAFYRGEMATFTEKELALIAEALEMDVDRLLDLANNDELSDSVDDRVVDLVLSSIARARAARQVRPGVRSQVVAEADRGPTTPPLVKIGGYTDQRVVHTRGNVRGVVDDRGQGSARVFVGSQLVWEGGVPDLRENFEQIAKERNAPESSDADMAAEFIGEYRALRAHKDDKARWDDDEEAALLLALADAHNLNPGFVAGLPAADLRSHLEGVERILEDDPDWLKPIEGAELRALVRPLERAILVAEGQTEFDFTSPSVEPGPADIARAKVKASAPELEAMLANLSGVTVKAEIGRFEVRVGRRRFGLYPAPNGTWTIKSSHEGDLKTPEATRLKKVVKEYNEGEEYRASWDRVGVLAREGMTKKTLEELEDVIAFIDRQPLPATHKERVERELAQQDRRAEIARRRGGATGPTTDADRERADIERRRLENKARREAALRKLNDNLKNTATSGVDPANIGLVIEIIDSYIDDGIQTFREIILEFRKAYGRREDLDEYFDAAWEVARGETVSAASIQDDTEAEEPTAASAQLYAALNLKTLPTDNKEVKALITRVIPGADPNSNEMLNAATDAIEAVLADGLKGQMDFDLARELEKRLTRAYRTPEKKRLQQFSTPLPIAVGAVQAARLKFGDRVLEPTAGTGNLIAPIGEVGASITVSELDPSRVALLKAQGWEDVREANYLQAPLEKNTYDVIITNPPWGKYSTGKYGQPIAGTFTPGDVAERFVARNVLELKPGGRLVAVMPTTMLGASGVNFRNFLDKNGKVRAVIKSPPGGYDTRGTTVESILLVFDKAGGTYSEGGRVTRLEIQSWADYEAAIAEVPARGEAITVEQPAPTGRPSRSGARGGRGARPGRASRGGKRGAVRDRQPGAPDVVAPDQPADGEQLEGPRRTQERPARVDTTDPTRGFSAEQLAAYQAAERSSNFAPYRLRTTLNGLRHPRVMVEARGLAGVEYPPLEYEPTAFFEQIIAAGRASIEQGEQALAAAQANIVGKHGYLAADNVGVGKAREAWLVAIEMVERARNEGRPMRLLLTTKGSDNIDNLIHSELPALVGSDHPGFEVFDVSTYKDAAQRSGRKKDERGVLPVAEYGIYVVDSYNLAAFGDALLEVPLNGIIGDEAHLFKNIGGSQVGSTWRELHSKIFTSVPREHQVFSYFTATPAQSVEDYQYLFGLRLWPIDGFNDWVDMVTGAASEEDAQKLRAAAEAGVLVDPDKGQAGSPEWWARRLEATHDETLWEQIEALGLTEKVKEALAAGVGTDSSEVAQGPRQPLFGGRSDAFSSRLTTAEGEQVTREWKRMGRFSSRDLWREGTEFTVVTHQLDNTAIARYDQFAQLARDIIHAARKWGKKNKANRTGIGSVKSQLQFAAKRVQMQPALEQAVKIAKEHLASGHQVVLSMINVSEFDAESGNIFAAIKQINIHDIDVAKDGQIIDNGEIPEALQARANLLEQAADLDKLPSPIEFIENAFGRDNVAFIIGAEQKNRVAHAQQFQEGKRAVAVISAAGSTGISLDHRVEAPGEAKGRRVFIDVQFDWSATQAIQRYGRVDRASQLTPPKIIALNFGTAGEKKFLSTIANRLASLGALSKGGAETTGTDLEEFEINGGESIAAAREAWNNLTDETKEYFIGSDFEERTKVQGGEDIIRPAKRTDADLKSIMQALLYVPTELANDYWEKFVVERDRIRAMQTESEDRRTRAHSGDILRTIQLSPELTLHQVKDDNGAKFGILSGVVMPEMPRLKNFLPITPSGNTERRYVSFTGKTADGQSQVVAGLEIRWTATSGLARFYGRALKADVLDTPEKVMEALRAGDIIPLQQNDARGKPWQIRMRRDQRIVVDGVKMADSKLVMAHGVGYNAAGNWWEVKDLPKFLERFPAAKPKIEATAEELADDSGDETADSNRPSGAVRPPRPGPPPSTSAPPRGTTTPPATAGSVPFNRLSPMEMPELVELAQELLGIPEVVKRFRKLGTLGQFRSGLKGASIRLHASLFQRGREIELAATLAHEIGHLVDWLPHRLLKRGNILGRIFSLRKFLKGTFTSASGTEFSNKEIRDELLAVTRQWSPYNPADVSAAYKQYRESASELFADALSALLTNPGWLEQKAPTFYAAFFEGLDTKPDVKAAYFELQAFLGGASREDLIDRRHGRVMDMFRVGNTKAIDLQERLKRERKEARRSKWIALKIQMLDKNAAVVDRVRKLEKQGVRLPEAQDPRYYLEERNYLGGKIKGWIERAIQPVYRDVLDAGIDWHQFGAALMYERIAAGDRGDVANSLGVGPREAYEQYTRMRQAFTPEQRQALDRNIEAWRAAYAEVARAAYRSGLYTDQAYQNMLDNPEYATFQVIEFIDDGMSSTIFRQTGTLKEITNPADAMLLKALVTIQATEHNNVKRATFDMLEQHYPGDIEQARERWTGKGKEPIDPLPRDKGKKVLITYKEKGKLRGKYVDPYIASSLNNETIGQNWLPIVFLRQLNSGFFRPVFTTINLGFQTFNVARDFFRFWKNIPTMSIGRAVLRYWQAIPLARVRAFGLPDKPTKQQLDAYEQLVQAEETKILSITFNDVIAGRTIEDEQIDDIIARSGVGEFKPEETALRRKTLLKPAFIALDFIRNVGDFIETLPKAAAIHEFRGNGSVTDLTPAQRSHIRKNVGSPDFLAGGTTKPIFNEVFLFSNAIIQATAADLRIARNPKTRAGWMFKTIMLNVGPKAFVAAMLMGAGGEERKRLYQKISEYDLTNYINLALGRDAEGNTIYFRMPQDDTGRLIGGLFWKALQLGRGEKDVWETIAQVADYTGGQIPSVTPVVSAVQTSAQYLAGQNPYDTFRGRNVFTDDEWKARNADTLKKFLGWQFQQMGGGIVWKFVPGEPMPRTESAGQKLLNLPVVSNVIGRWIKVSSYGETERLKAAVADVDREEARERQLRRKEINKAVREFNSLQPWEQTESRRRQMARDIAKTVYPGLSSLERAEKAHRLERSLKISIRRGEVDPYADRMLAVTSNKQKAAVIQAARESMSPAEFRSWYDELRRDKLISDALHELARGK